MPACTSFTVLSRFDSAPSTDPGTHASAGFSAAAVSPAVPARASSTNAAHRPHPLLGGRSSSSEPSNRVAVSRLPPWGSSSGRRPSGSPIGTDATSGAPSSRW